MTVPKKHVLPILILALISLLSAIWAGWSRIGWRIPVPPSGLVLNHGPLMTICFLGSLISLERAVALKKTWMFTAPILMGVAGLVLIAGISSFSGKIILSLGSFIFVLIQIAIVLTHSALYTWALLAGALCALIGNILWLGSYHVHQVVWWWAFFLVYTIAGERLELGRVVRLPLFARIIFTALCTLALLGLISTTMKISLGYTLIGICLLGLGAWFLRYDIARKAILRSVQNNLQLTRYIAIALLLGFVWLALSGITVILFSFPPAGLIYDSILHMLFIGFVFSMIFGHAPIILPSLFGLRFNFESMLYFPLILLHLSLTLRIWGDLSRQVILRSWGGLLNGIAILLFLGLMLVTIYKSKVGFREVL